MDAPSPVSMRTWRMSLLVNLVCSGLTDMDELDGRIGSGCFTPVLSFTHILPALDSRLRGNDGLMWERGLIGADAELV